MTWEFWRLLMQSYHWRLAARAIIVAVLLAALVALFVFVARPARADVPGFGEGCETVHWHPLGLNRRTICDGEKRPDGSWLREREVWTPPGVVPGYCGYGSCYSSYYRARSTVAYEQYPVTDATVLPDEPGYLPSGTVIYR